MKRRLSPQPHTGSLQNTDPTRARPALQGYGLNRKELDELDTLVHLRHRAPGVFITNLPYPELAFYAANAKSFRNVIGVSERNQAVFGETVSGSAPEQIQVAFATSNYFAEFGIVPASGRLLTPDDERRDAGPVALIGELFWQMRLGGDPSVIGQSIRVNGKLVRVVGVMPRSTRARFGLWMPLVRQPYESTAASSSPSGIPRWMYMRA